jgi:hypothetical protein
LTLGTRIRAHIWSVNRCVEANFFLTEVVENNEIHDMPSIISYAVVRVRL